LIIQVKLRSGFRPFRRRGRRSGRCGNVGHRGGYAACAAAPHFARGDAWVSSPLIKICFADKSLAFDFTEPRKEFARGAIREFMPAGERTLVIPAK